MMENKKYSSVGKFPNDHFFCHNFLVGEYFTLVISVLKKTMNTHIHNVLTGVYRYLCISCTKSFGFAWAESFRTILKFGLLSK